MWRRFGDDNTTVFGDTWLYGIETLMHELMLSSEHRTLDPEEADFFYVPAYLSCYLWPVHGWADFPSWYTYSHRKRHSVVLPMNTVTGTVLRCRFMQ